MLGFFMRYHVVRKGRVRTLWAGDHQEALKLAGATKGKAVVWTAFGDEPAYRGGKLSGTVLASRTSLPPVEYRDGEAWLCYDGDFHKMTTDDREGITYCDRCGRVDDS